MIIKTKDFQDVAKKILLATSLDKNACNLELITKGSDLYLNVTNKEYFVAIKFALDTPEEFHATVDANLFLSLISALTTETFTLSIKKNSIEIKSGKSSYTLAMIYDNESLLVLTPITIQNKTVEMNISKDILDSIVNVNSRELEKIKGVANVNELFELYYIDDTGCFTFNTGACLNAFKLEKPVKLLLNERIVKLFKLFNEDVHFSLGQDTENNISKTKIILETSTVYLAAIITCDDRLISKIQAPCEATKKYINDKYDYHVVISSTLLKEAINRLTLFTKNTNDKQNMRFITMNIKITPNEFIISDNFGNIESLPIENGSFVENEYEMIINIIDLKLVVESCKNEHITINCGNKRSIIVNRGNISNLIPECRIK